MAKIKIIGTGIYVPGPPIDNDEVKKLTGVEFDSEKIRTKIGISKRHIAHLKNINETSADFATYSCMNAIKSAQLDPKAINLFVVGSDTPEYISPATSILVQGRIQEGETFAGAFDISASCASFTKAFHTVSMLMKSDPAIEYAAVTGVYNMPAFIRPGDAFGYSIFADGAGTIILKRCDDDESSDYQTGQFMTDGTQWDYIGVYRGGTKNPAKNCALENDKWGLELLKRLPPDRNIRLWPVVANKLCEKAGIEIADIDHMIFTQINRSVIEEVVKILGRNMEDTTCVMDRYGYTGSACIPMAFHHAVLDKKIKRGNKIMLIASGSGFAVGGNIFTY